jgi:hypothetical protein
MKSEVLIRTWAVARQVPSNALSPSGRLTLHVDGRYRVHLMPAPNDQVAIEARVCELPLDRTQRERLIEEALQLSAGRMRDHRAALALDLSGDSLLLQDAVAASAGSDALTETVGRFVNSLSFWQKALR